MTLTDDLALRLPNAALLGPDRYDYEPQKEKSEGEARSAVVLPDDQRV